MKELLLRTITGILLIVLVIGSILLGPLPFLVVTITIYGLAIRELVLAYSFPDLNPLLLIVISAGALIPLAYLILDANVSTKWVFLPMAGWLIGFIWSGFRLPGVLALFWISIPLTSFYILGWIREGDSFHKLIPLSVIVLVWVNDTFAYVSGSLLGRHKLTPRLSPGKTWEGLLGGIVFTMLGGWIIFKICNAFYIILWLAGALLISILGLFGDLFESSLKRKLNVKNMGELLPGHGGILDRFDSLLLVAPVILILLILMKLRL